MSRKILYFTFSFPYKQSSNWERTEIEQFSALYDEVIVVPFSSSDISEYDYTPADNVRILKPIKDSQNMRKAIFKLLYSKNWGMYLREFVSKRVFMSKSALREWLAFSTYQELYKSSETLKEVSRILDDDTDVYHFWGASNFYLPLTQKKTWRNSYLKVHGFDIYEERHPHSYLPYRPSLYRAFDTILTISENGKSYLKEKYGDDIKAKVQYLGANAVGKINPNVEDLKNRPLRLVSCSYILDLKRINLIIDILSQVEVPVEWTHIGGDGKAGQKFTLDVLEAKAQESLEGTQTKAVFTGNMPPDEIQNFLYHGNFDMFITTSYTEGLPVSLMEALGTGIPAIATDVGGISEIVKTGETGYLIDRDFDVSEVSELITSFYNLPENQIRKMKENALSLYLEKLDMKKNAARLAKEIFSAEHQS